MGKLMLVALLAACVAVSYPSPHGFKSMDDMVDYINGLDTTWKATKNFDGQYLNTVGPNLGLLPRDPAYVAGEAPAFDPSLAIPESFDSRQQWPDCKSIKEIRDQASCGSCWAFAVAEAISDRICVASGGKQQVEISAENINDCSGAGGCNGGFMEEAYEYYVSDGVVTGGLYKSNVGCQPYTIPGCEHHVSGPLPACSATVPTPRCQEKCVAGYNGTYESDKHYGSKSYGVSSVQAIQQDIQKHGPVVAGFSVYTDFLTYKSGVYHHVTGKMEGGHAVKILGWGVESGVDYWLVANSWNADWGDKGYFKIRRGHNEGGIEGRISAGLPKL